CRSPRGQADASAALDAFGTLDLTTLPLSPPAPIEDTPTTSSPASGDQRAAELLGAAFRDLHGPRLHGFALLLMLGDRRAAGVASGRALSAGVARAQQLRHP